MTAAALLAGRRHVVPVAPVVALSSAGLAVARWGSPTINTRCPRHPACGAFCCGARGRCFASAGCRRCRSARRWCSRAGRATCLAALGIVWAINLFNFMDGIDGLAAGEAMFMSPGRRAAGWPCRAGRRRCRSRPDLCRRLRRFPAVELAAGAHLSRRRRQWLSRLRHRGVGTGGDAAQSGRAVGVAGSRRRFFCRRHGHPGAAHAARGAGLPGAPQSCLPVAGPPLGEPRSGYGAVLVVDLLWLVPWAVVARRHPPLAVTAVLLAFIPLAVLALLLGAGRLERNGNVR